MAASDAVKELEGLFVVKQNRKRPVRLWIEKKGQIVCDDLVAAKATLTGNRKAGVQDWILAKKVDGAVQKWFFVPEVIQSQRESVLGDMAGKGDDTTGVTNHDIFLAAVRREGFEPLTPLPTSVSGSYAPSTGSAPPSTIMRRNRSEGTSLNALAMSHSKSEPNFMKKSSSSASSSDMRPAPGSASTAAS